MDREFLKLIDYNSCVALIPARGGSKSVPKKNIRLFQGYPLLAYSIAAGRLSRQVERVIVSTDSKEIAEVARQYGAEVPFLRPEKYAQDQSPDIDFMKHAIEWFAVHEKKIPEYLVHLRPTTPLRDPAQIDKAVCQIRKDLSATSLRSGSLCVHPPYKWFQEKGTYLMPLMPGITCDEANMPRQDFPAVYIPNGYVDIVKSDFVIQSNLMHGDRMIGFQTNEVPDIDTEFDLKKMDLYDGMRDVFCMLQKNIRSIEGR